MKTMTCTLLSCLILLCSGLNADVDHKTTEGLREIRDLANRLLEKKSADKITPEERLASLDISLPEVSPAIANYVGAVRTGNLIFLAGHLPRDGAGGVITGKLGDDLDSEAGYEAARAATIALLATLKAELGELDRVTRIVKVFGMVNATPDFTAHSQVINGASDLLGEVFGERGRHARAAAGFSSLPVGAAVEVEMIVEVRD